MSLAASISGQVNTGDGVYMVRFFD